MYQTPYRAPAPTGMATRRQQMDQPLGGLVRLLSELGQSTLFRPWTP
ncbi:hypothetical protein [Thiosulfatihalobacter marinus]|jgi:hypothetical protein|nr:hypothetical protein [Thiosulfatihalobacter marinus]